MSDDLEAALAELAAAPAERSLSGMEARISREIEARRREALAARPLRPVQMAAVALALAIGVAAGGTAAVSALHAPRGMAAFAAGTQLAPSTLLDSRR